MIPFEKDEWIIATKPLVTEIVLSNGQVVKQTDSSFTDWPIKIVDITEGHIVYEHPFFEGKRILPFFELSERGFIIANPVLINIGLEERHKRNR